MNIKRGDIYYATFDAAVGSEQNGERPVLIIQNDTGNRWSPTVIVAAVSNRIKKTALPTHVEIDADFLAKDSIALLEQVRTIDKLRLGNFLGAVDNETMSKIDEAIKISMGVS
ncbi:MAG: type II toxin-antitoxin system PemK/MazF family toxin [Synergistaceae bacterium]|nr:type II toxin-antitoxin system PemK/MazF family toxin [Synergistaceae bacterium]